MCCKDCRFWSKYNETCNLVECEYMIDFELEDKASFQLFTTAEDDSGLYAELRTGPEFGCVKFQPKA